MSFLEACRCHCPAWAIEGFLTTDLPFILPASSLCLHPSLFLIKDYTAFTLKMKDVVTCLIVWLSLKDICSLSHTQIITAGWAHLYDVIVKKKSQRQQNGGCWVMEGVNGVLLLHGYRVLCAQDDNIFEVVYKMTWTDVPLLKYIHHSFNLKWVQFPLGMMKMFSDWLCWLVHKSVLRTSEWCELCCIRRMVKDNVKTLISDSPFRTPFLLCNGNGSAVIFTGRDLALAWSQSQCQPVQSWSSLEGLELAVPRHPSIWSRGQDGWRVFSDGKSQSVMWFLIFLNIFLSLGTRAQSGAAQAAKPRPTQMQGTMQHPYVTHSGNGKPSLSGPEEGSCLWRCSIEMWTYHLRHSVHGVVCLGVKYMWSRQK